MMQHLRAAAIIASILCIVSVMYFVAVRGGSVDLPLPWGQSATVQIPEPGRDQKQEAHLPQQTSPYTPSETREPYSQHPEVTRESVPVREGGVDPWGNRYDALVGVTTPPGVSVCGFVRITRGFFRSTPQEVIQSFSNVIITRVCSAPPSERVFPQGETCEATPNWHEGAPYRREACYTFTPWSNPTP